MQILVYEEGVDRVPVQLFIGHNHASRELKLTTEESNMLMRLVRKLRIEEQQFERRRKMKAKSKAKHHDY